MVEPILNALAHFTTSVIGAIGLSGVVLLMAIESANVPFPSELIMPFAGFLVAQGQYNLLIVVLAGTLGNWIGSALSYWLGATGGRTLVLKYGRFVRLNEGHLKQSERWFAKYGEISVFFGRMLPIVRTFISLPAGFARMNFGKFSFYTVLGAFPFVYLLTWLGFKLGENWESLRQYFHYIDIAIILIIFIYLGRILLRRYLKPKSVSREQ